MKKIFPLYLSFRTKVTVAFIFSLFLVTLLSNILIYRVSLESQFQQLRHGLMAVTQTASLLIDGDTLRQVPLDRDGVNSGAYQAIAAVLRRIKDANPRILYVYTMTQTQKHGAWQFIVDIDPVVKDKNNRVLTSYPGDPYDASRFPEMEKAFEAPSADKKLMVDEWGATLSGYAPVRDKTGRVIAMLGIDISAKDVFDMERELNRRSLIVLALGIVCSLLLGIWVSARTTGPVLKLREATRRIAAGDLGYKVDIKGHDEISQLGNSFNEMAKSLLESRKALRDYFYRIVESLVRGLEAKDSYTRGHSDRVADYSRAIALQMGFGAEEANMLRETAQLHDIGKLGIDERILNKVEKLTDEEWATIKQHPVTGEEILKPVFLEKKMLAVVRSHHERYDGRGYPDGLKEGQIDPWAQIVTAADAYDAMTSRRSYRDALSKETAIAELKKGSGTQFAPAVVEAFLKVLA
ncbi:MAG: HD domain-containing protein [Candidatus Omnitrophica bacterium]|nr:HD domain-containing protein [Candidatus Omnitrophota bacterium]